MGLWSRCAFLGVYFALSMMLIHPARADWGYSEFSDGKLARAQACDPTKDKYCVGLKCVSFGKPELYWFIDAPDKAHAAMSTISLWNVDGAGFVLDMERAGPAESGIQHYEDSYDPDGSQFIDAMTTGETLSVRSDLIGAFKVSLDQARSGIEKVIAACERASNETGPQTAAVKPPNRHDIRDIVRWVFESNKCVATEQQLFDPIANDPNYGISVANRTVIDTSNSADVTVISRNPYTYRFSGSELCGGQGKGAQNAAIEVLPIKDNGWSFDTWRQSEQGTLVCADDDANTRCFSLSCRQGEALQYVWFFSGGSIREPIPAQIYVDGELVEEITLKPMKPDSELRADSDVNSRLLSRLKNGSKMMLALPGKGHQFSLRGSNRAIQKAERACNAASQRNTDADAIIQSEVKVACDGGHGNVDQRGVVVQDLNDDGHDDIIIGHDAISCSGGISRSLFCGAQVCSTKIFLGQNESFVEKREILGILEGVSSGSPPVMNFYVHGGAKVRMKWNGAGFSQF